MIEHILIVKIQGTIQRIIKRAISDRSLKGRAYKIAINTKYDGYQED